MDTFRRLQSRFLERSFLSEELWTLAPKDHWKLYFTSATPFCIEVEFGGRDFYHLIALSSCCKSTYSTAGCCNSCLAGPVSFLPDRPTHGVFIEDPNDSIPGKAKVYGWSEKPAEAFASAESWAAELLRTDVDVLTAEVEIARFALALEELHRLAPMAVAHRRQFSMGEKAVGRWKDFNDSTKYLSWKLWRQHEAWLWTTFLENCRKAGVVAPEPPLFRGSLQRLFGLRG